MILAGHPRPTGASLHTGGNTPPAPQIVIFKTGLLRQGTTPARSAERPSQRHLPWPITEFAPEPMPVAETPEKRSHAGGRRHASEAQEGSKCFCRPRQLREHSVCHGLPGTTNARDAIVTECERINQVTAVKFERITMLLCFVKHFWFPFWFSFRVSWPGSGLGVAAGLRTRQGGAMEAGSY